MDSLLPGQLSTVVVLMALVTVSVPATGSASDMPTCDQSSSLRPASSHNNLHLPVAQAVVLLAATGSLGGARSFCQRLLISPKTPRRSHMLFRCPFYVGLLLLFAVSDPSVLAMTELYGVRNSGWTSPQWNWGYAQGTGHDCAAICRRQFASRDARRQLVGDLKRGQGPENFEEVKLVLALAWQRGRWDGSDGGPGGYGDVLEQMAAAQRYEVGEPVECSRRLVADMSEKFALLNPSQERQETMKTVLEVASEDWDKAQRRCSGLVLEAMDYIASGP